jgi:hypothetical protein
VLCRCTGYQQIFEAVEAAIHAEPLGRPEGESLRSRPRDAEAAPASGGSREPNRVTVAPRAGDPEGESLRSSPRDSEAAPASGGGAPREVNKR